MVRQPRESESVESEPESLDEAVDGSAGSRRQFLQLGAVSAIGFAGACTVTTPGDDGIGGFGGAGTGGTGTGGTGTPGTGGTGTGGSGTGGTGTGGSVSNTGGTGTGGTGTGGSVGTTGGTGTGGTGAAGHPAAGAGNAPGGGAPGTGGAPATGGGPATGGAPPQGGMGGSSAGQGMGGSAGAGQVSMGTWKENNYTPLPTLPDGTHGPSLPKLPDPFKFLDGTRITSKADWERLRADLSAKIQAAVYGPKMPPPDKVEASISGTTVTVKCTVGSKSGSFTFTIKAGSGKPSPAVIRCASSGCPFPGTVATIDFAEHTIADENKMWPTTGLVSTLYGNTAAKSGSDICWAWGTSRIIDALEQLGPDATGINTHAIATTGCSFAGKGALAMGAFDERVALTVMQEGGSGGSALWRVSTAEAAKGQNIQEATEIVGEQNWEGKDFHDLFSGKSKTSAPVDMLIADQHFVAAICAPRAVLLIDNDIDWLGPVAAYGGGVAAREVFTALGITDRLGISVAPNHSHCQFPSSQQAPLTAFINRFLLGMKTDTSGVDLLVTGPNGTATNSKLKTFNKADWIDWDTPTLAGAYPWEPFST